MEIFFSWSGKNSKKIAEELSLLVQSTIQFVKPWISSQDLRSGENWPKKLSTKLKQVSFGIFCFTPENKKSDWMCFEGGAIAKDPDTSILIPYLHRVSFSDIPDAFRPFQCTNANREETLAMINDINERSEERRKTEVINNVFEPLWEKYEKVLGEITYDKEDLESNKDKEEVVLDNIYNEVRSLSSQTRRIESCLGVMPNISPRGIPRQATIVSELVRRIKINLKEDLNNAVFLSVLLKDSIEKYLYLSGETKDNPIIREAKQLLTQVDELPSAK